MKKIQQASSSILLSAALLTSNCAGTMSIKNFCENYNLSSETTDLLTRNISESLIQDTFEFDRDEFSKHIS